MHCCVHCQCQCILCKDPEMMMPSRAGKEKNILQKLSRCLYWAPSRSKIQELHRLQCEASLLWRSTSFWPFVIRLVLGASRTSPPQQDSHPCLHLFRCYRVLHFSDSTSSIVWVICPLVIWCVLMCILMCILMCTDVYIDVYWCVLMCTDLDMLDWTSDARLHSRTRSLQAQSVAFASAYAIQHEMDQVKPWED